MAYFSTSRLAVPVCGSVDAVTDEDVLSPPSWTTSLEEIMPRDVDDEKDMMLFLHKNEGEFRNIYTSAEKETLTKRSFESRLFISSTNFGGNTAFLRTHFSDNHPMKCGKSLNFVRDYLKAAQGGASGTGRNKTAAKSTLTRLLTICLDADESCYSSFAITMASALSNTGANACFERGDRDKSDHHIQALVNSDEELKEIRLELCRNMHIIFSKIQKYQFMINDEGSNAFRLFHCRTVTTTDKVPLLYASFSFLLQVCLTGYIVAQLYLNLDSGVYSENKWHRNLPLALLTLIYSTILAIPEFKGTPEGFKIFGKVGILQSMDFLVNAILPSILIVSGFAVILGQEEFIDSVLNTAALLFIPEIDDHMPSLLGFNEKAIVKNFLIHEAMREFDALHDDDTSNDSILGNVFDEGMGVQFVDYFLTNVPEQGSCTADGIIFQPFGVSKGQGNSGDQIDPSCYITKNCLIKKLTWQYTLYGNSTKPRIGYLKIEMLGEDETIEVKRPADEAELIELGEPNELEGVFVITTFQMSDDILRLRVCGSKKAVDFEKAFEYYTLWPLSSRAKKTLREAKKNEKAQERMANRASRRSKAAQADQQV